MGVSKDSSEMLDWSLGQEKALSQKGYPKALELFRIQKGNRLRLVQGRWLLILCMPTPPPHPSSTPLLPIHWRGRRVETNFFMKLGYLALP